MIKEVLVVEGKSDVAAVNRAVEVDCLITGGFSGLNKKTLANIEAAYKKRGIIILTDPDRAGENIRAFLTKRFPDAKHAYIPRDEATANDDIGVEQASPESIRKALQKVHTTAANFREEFTVQEMIESGISGSSESSRLRDKVGAVLGIGYGNVKTFVKRLNTYGITRSEFEKAVSSCH